MTRQEFISLMKERVLLLDGAMGTMIQRLGLSEADYRGERFKDIKQQVKGNNDLLNITQPLAIADIHRQYLEAGSDIFTTNTFNSNAISMEDYGMSDLCREINVSAGSLSRRVADDFMAEHPERQVFIAGSLGPTNKTASMSPDVNDPAFRSVSYDDMYDAYYEQAEGLIDGGVDLLLFETVFDTLNVKAGLEAAEALLREKQLDMPIMLSLTLAAKGWRTFSGQTIEAFLASLQHIHLTTVGLNCSFGAVGMQPYVKELARMSPYYISVYPNAGLPNSLGEYDETPELMALHVKSMVEEGYLNILGGCCGTTPDHIAYFPQLTRNIKPHIPSQIEVNLRLSGLELLEIKPENNFVNIGERCNVAGSRKFLRLIKEQSYDEALMIARKQVENGAQVIDINMDDGLLDTEKEMVNFLNLIASEPDIARVPIMIDSSKWEVIEKGLKCVQGKCIVNSISLKEGEAKFLYKAQRVKRLGAAVVVMAFDEQGQADSFERKISVCQRAYNLLVNKVDFNPQDIIFDPNVLAISTGIEEHNRYGLDFILAVEWIKQNLPSAHVSGGVSNLSFSFRGNNYVREAMHAVFLYHAIAKGMDMGIVNPTSSVLYDEIEPAFRALLEEVILYRRPNASEELIAWAQDFRDKKTNTTSSSDDSWRNLSVGERLEHALIKGLGDYLKEDIAEALTVYPNAVDIVAGPLMEGMNIVGKLFGSGKMFLPQVVKTARTMKKAVTELRPAMEVEKIKSGSSTSAGKVIFATVKGDVHDIGKNIVSIVLACNNYEVIDLGVMVPSDVIVQKAIEEKPDLVCLSGLITPSLDEMTEVVKQMDKAGLTIPVMVGGATTSKLHTAIKIAPYYKSPVIHVSDASQNPLIASRLLDPKQYDAFVQELREEQANLRLNMKQKEPLLSLAEARKCKVKFDWSTFEAPVPKLKGIKVLDPIPVATLIPYISWGAFFTTWKLSSRFSKLASIDCCPGCQASWLADFSAEDRIKAVEAMHLYKDAQQMLADWIALEVDYCKAAVGIFPARAEGDDLMINEIRFPMIRQQQKDTQTGFCRSLADYVCPASERKPDYVGVFVTTAGAGTDQMLREYKKADDPFKALLAETLLDRLAEANSEYMHQQVRKEFWGYASDEKVSISQMLKGNYQGIRPATGYSSLPDQRMVFQMNKLLDFSRLNIQLTENGAMHPIASTCGFYFAHPEASYFHLSAMSEEQAKDYAQRSGQSFEQIKHMLNRMIR